MEHRGGKAAASLTAEQVMRRLAALELMAVEFYQGLLEGTESKRIAKIASMMVKAEQRHHDRFLAYAESAKTSDNPDEYVLTKRLPPHLAKYMTTHAWPKRESVKKSAKYAPDVEMVKHAIAAEKRQADALNELRECVPRAHQKYLSRVMREEQGHQAKLEEILKKYFAD